MDTVPTKPIKQKPSPPSTISAVGSPVANRGGWRTALTWWVWLLGALLGFAIAIVSWTILFAAPLPRLPADIIPPNFTVFPPPSLTPIPPTFTPTPLFSPTPALPTVMPGTFGIGAMVEVVVDGCRLRDAPSLSGKILSQASAHELFTIIDGPRQNDAYTWWLLQGVFDKARQGWMVEVADERCLKPS
jgi:hypothetical protein